MSHDRAAPDCARPEVSVLVPCYRDAHLVARSLPRILDGSRRDLEVLLLNNDTAQSEELRRVVSALGDPRARVLELEHRAGFARAINAGIGATTGALVFFANSDLFVAHGYLDELAAFFARRPRAGCAAGKILRYDLERQRETSVIDSTGLTIGRNRRVADRGENERDTGRYEREEEVFGVSGAALVARREALEAVAVRGKYLDESFDMYKEDIDLCWRVRLAGWECWYVPQAVAFHARTVHGLAGKPYLSAVWEYHGNERSKPRRARTNSMRNQWLMLVKNEDVSNLMRDLPHVLGREALVLGFNTFETPRDTATAVGAFVRALPESIAARRAIKARQTMPPDRMRGWFFAGARRRATQ